MDVLDSREGATESGAGGVLQVRNDVPIAAVCRYWRSHSVKQMFPRDYAHTHRHTCSHACMRVPVPVPVCLLSTDKRACVHATY